MVKDLRISLTFLGAAYVFASACASTGYSSDFLSKLFFGKQAQKSLELAVRHILVAGLLFAFPNDQNTNGMNLEMKYRLQISALHSRSP